MLIKLNRIVQKVIKPTMVDETDLY